MNIIIKPTNNCNFDCLYCYNAGASTSRVMSVEEAKRIINKVYTASDDRTIRFIWHGGEPLLMGEDFYRNILEYTQEIESSSRRIKHSIQTNGFLLRTEYIDLFTMCKVPVK